MSKYNVQVFYIKYVTAEADSEKEAEYEAKRTLELELEEEPIQIRDLTFTTTDEIEE